MIQKEQTILRREEIEQVIQRKTAQDQDVGMLGDQSGRRDLSSEWFTPALRAMTNAKHWGRILNINKI